MIGQVFKRTDKNRVAYHEIKVIAKKLEYSMGQKIEDTSASPKFYECVRVFPTGNHESFLVAEENFDAMYEPTKIQGELSL